MFVATVILILLGALLSLFTAIRALGAYLRFRRARATFQSEVTDEVDRLAARTDELERNLSALDARASELPIQISELQQNLNNLQVLTRALGIDSPSGAKDPLFQRAQDAQRRPHWQDGPERLGPEKGRHRLGSPVSRTHRNVYSRRWTRSRHSRRRQAKHCNRRARTARSAARRCTGFTASSSVPTVATAATALILRAASYQPEPLWASRAESALSHQPLTSAFTRMSSQSSGPYQPTLSSL